MTSIDLAMSTMTKESALVAFCYNAEIPSGKSLEETVWWILTDFFAKSLVIEPKSLKSQLEYLESQWESLESQWESLESPESKWTSLDSQLEYLESQVKSLESLRSLKSQLESQWKSLESPESRIPVVETSANERGNTDRSPREDGGANHYNLIQIKGRRACVGQPKVTSDGSVQYYY